jgi:hypothetical protein
VNDRAFNLDFFIAVSAVVVSALTAAALIYQTHVIGNQFAATIWPYLSVGTTYDPNGETIEVTNDGLGPALVRSAQLKIDDTPVRAWNDYVRVLVTDPALRAIFRRTQAAVEAGKGRSARISMSSIGPSTTLRPGESDTLLKISLSESVPGQLMRKHTLSIDLCYCSLNGSCWTLHAAPGRINADPRSVSGCASNLAIESNLFTAPPTRSPASAH